MTRVMVGAGGRRWIRVYLEADSPRVRCCEHGVVAAQVPWARHGSGRTYALMIWRRGW